MTQVYIGVSVKDYPCYLDTFSHWRFWVIEILIADWRGHNHLPNWSSLIGSEQWLKIFNVKKCLSDLQRNSDCLFFFRKWLEWYFLSKMCWNWQFFELLNDVLFLNSIFERRKLIWNGTNWSIIFAKNTILVNCRIIQFVMLLTF